MNSVNTCTLLGHLTRDPELRYTPSGTAVAQFGLAINRKWKSEDGQWQELTETTFNEKKLTHLTRRLQGMSNDVQHLVYRLQHK